LFLQQKQTEKKIEKFEPLFTRGFVVLDSLDCGKKAGTHKHSQIKG